MAQTDPAGVAPGGWRRRAGRLLDVLMPPQCLKCGALVERAGALCADCWEQIRFIAPPQCDRCGLPFDHDLGDGALCGACARKAPAFARARAAMVYDAASRDLILAFKHGDRTDAAPALGRWLVRAGADLVDEADLVAPVPLHWSRLFARRFNQAALLAQAVGRQGGLPVLPDLLVRRRRTRSLGGLGRSARKRALAGAITLKSGRRAAVAGRRVLLVDDVLTTGATAAACARCLLRGGAAAVDVLVLARVVRARS